MAVIEWRHSTNYRGVEENAERGTEVECACSPRHTAATLRTDCRIDARMDKEAQWAGTEATAVNTTPSALNTKG